MVDVTQSLVTVLAQMVSTDKPARSRVQVSHLEKTVDSRVNVQESIPRGVMRLPENAVANLATTVITANGCALQDYSVQDVQGSVNVHLE